VSDIAADLGRKLLELALAGKLTAGAGSAAVQAARAESDALAWCQTVSRVARSLAYACELRQRATVEASERSAERQIVGAIAELGRIGQAVPFAGQSGTDSSGTQPEGKT
jgi:predicted deacylase